MYDKFECQTSGRSDLRILQVLREASRENQMKERLEKLHVKNENHENNQHDQSVPTLLSFNGEHENNQQNDDDTNEESKHLTLVEETNRKKNTIETPRSRFLRECSQSQTLTGAQLFGIAVLKREDEEAAA